MLATRRGERSERRQGRGGRGSRKLVALSTDWATSLHAGRSAPSSPYSTKPIASHNRFLNAVFLWKAEARVVHEHELCTRGMGPPLAGVWCVCLFVCQAAESSSLCVCAHREAESGAGMGLNPMRERKRCSESLSLRPHTPCCMHDLTFCRFSFSDARLCALTTTRKHGWGRRRRRPIHDPSTQCHAPNSTPQAADAFAGIFLRR